jgi:hypothetical protein
MLLAAVLVCVGGCGLFPPSRSGRTPMDDLYIVRAGMDTDDLRYRIGSPDDVTTEPDGSERWTYLYGDEDQPGATSLVIHVRDDTVRTWEERPVGE